ncbi:MAG: hypothetical protein AAFV19_16120 [Pseudomonadota bacterium]
MSTATLPRLPTTARVWGTVTASDGATVRIAGLAGLAALGDDIEIGRGTDAVAGEIIALDDTAATAFLMDISTGLCAGDRAWLRPGGRTCPGDHWLGHMVDAYGQTPEGELLEPGPRQTPAAPVQRPGARRPLGPRLKTGLGALDTMLPLCQGQRLGVFAGSGVGKSRLVTDLACGVAADVVVIGLIGERSREVSDLYRALKAAGVMGRTVIVSATSDQSALVKRRASDLTLAAAAHFRDQGAHVLCLFDSVTRYAEAHREIALAAGEPPALRAFPPSTAPAIAALCERAGPGRESDTGGDITAVFTVLVAGSDMDEPVADMVRGVLDGHVVLDRAIAERGRFPAIDLRRSVSRSAPAAWSDAEQAVAAEARRLLAAYEDAAPMIQAGLYAPGADPLLDRAVEHWSALDDFIGSKSAERTDRESFAALAEILGMDLTEDEGTPETDAAVGATGFQPVTEQTATSGADPAEAFTPLGGSGPAGPADLGSAPSPLAAMSQPTEPAPGPASALAPMETPDLPPLGGDLPDLGGNLPDPGGDLPDLGGHLPELGGDLPNLGGDLSGTGEDLPELGRDLAPPETELPALGGDLPELDAGPLPNLPEMPDLTPPGAGDLPELSDQAIGLDALPDLPEPANAAGTLPPLGGNADPGFSVDGLPDLPDPANHPGAAQDLPDLPLPGGDLPDLPDVPDLLAGDAGGLPDLSDPLPDLPDPLPKLPRDD